MKKKLSARNSPSPLLNRIATVIWDHGLMHKGDKIIVAVSGGSDSLALLHILHGLSLSLELIAVYVDHGLRPDETVSEQKTIERHCQSLQTPFIVKSVNVHRLVIDEKRSTEDAARVLRYKELEKVRIEFGAKIIAVGHTADDQVEEFLIRLIRGSSCKGLSGMTVRRNDIVRPLLFERKDTLSEYLSRLGVSWCFDSSNSNLNFLRNRVRLDLLPKLEKEFNPSMRKTILQNMDILREENKFLETATDTEYTACVNHLNAQNKDFSSPKLCIKGVEMSRAHPAIRRRIIEKCFWDMGIRPTYDQINSVLKFMETTEKGKEIHLGDGVRAERRGHDLILGRPLRVGQVRGSQETAPSINQSIKGPGVHLVVGEGKELILQEMVAGTYNAQKSQLLRLDQEKISFPLELRSFRPGERFHPYGGPGSKKISRYFNEQKIPPKDRHTWPVLLCGKRVIALPGLQIDHNYRVTAQTSHILLVGWQDSEENDKKE